MDPVIKAGILFAPEVKFCLNGKYRHLPSGKIFEGCGSVVAQGVEPRLVVEGKAFDVQWPVLFEPVDYETASFDLKDVTIGINFHWERKQNQRFKGSIEVILESGHLTAINVVSLEDYLTSVISSEMSATSSTELLKAHAVISRSWLLAQIEKGKLVKAIGGYGQKEEAPGKRIRWYDREDHKNFDVCADDHCQRYQGITTLARTAAEDAIESTRGQVLVYQGKICDARYSKCCGGITERFENVWEPVKHPYLEMVIDNPEPPKGFETDLSLEQASKQWILASPQAFCNTTDKSVLAQVLKDYDQETFDFFRWEVNLAQERIQELLRTRVNVDVGQVLDLVALERGTSGRLVKLLVKGTTGNVIIGKELEIRKAFSPSHLYSAAFVAEKGTLHQGIPQSFILKGAGWGHGVGLCQIGAAVMGARGFNYKAILAHYFKGAELNTLY